MDEADEPKLTSAPLRVGGVAYHETTRPMTDPEMEEFAKFMEPFVNKRAPEKLVLYWEYCCKKVQHTIPPEKKQVISAANLAANGKKERVRYFQKEKVTSLGIQSRGGDPNLDKIVSTIDTFDLTKVFLDGQKVQCAARDYLRYADATSTRTQKKYEKALKQLDEMGRAQLALGADGGENGGNDSDGGSVASVDSGTSTGSTAMQPPKSKKSKSATTLKPPSKPAKNQAPGLTTPPKGGDKNTGTMNLVLPTPSPIKAGPRPWDEASKSSYHGHCGVEGNLCGWGHCTQCISLPGAKECSVYDRCGWYGTCKHCKYIWETKNQS